MKTEYIPLAPTTPGTSCYVTVHRFGASGARPRIYIQAALHADEIPGMLVAHHLRERLSTLESEGNVRGEIILVPSANPLGLGQKLLGQPVGRFHLPDGINYNRGYPYLVPIVAERLAGKMGDNPSENVREIRAALSEALAEWPVKTAAESLKKALVALAIEADLVLDLHCDAEAIMHLYTHSGLAAELSPLAALLGAKALLLAEESGDDPFDEAVSRPWGELAKRFPGHPIPFACVSTTIEFRGEADVSDEFARADAGALIDFLILRGGVAGEAGVIPDLLCEPTPLAGSEPIFAPATGIIVFAAQVGDRLRRGDIVLEIVDPLTGARSGARTTTDGVMFARVAVRFATQGQTLAKIAGKTPRRTGKLLTA